MNSRVLTVPNQLTFLRLAFLPFFIIFLYYDRFLWAFGLLLLAGLTDALDGMLARRLNQKTALGAFLDPIADKLLLSSSLFTLALKGRIDWWLAILVLSRDVIILATAAVIILVAGYRPFPPTFYGKATTTTQILLVVLVIGGGIVDSPLLEAIRLVVTFVVAAFTVFSGLHYSVLIARRLSSS